MKDDLEKILRRLAKEDGVSRAIAYATQNREGDEAERRLRQELRSILDREKLGGLDHTIVIDSEREVPSALGRRAFRDQVLLHLEFRDAPLRRPEPPATIVGRGAPERAREELRESSLRWTHMKDTLQAKLEAASLAAEEAVGAPLEEALPGPAREPPPSEAAPTIEKGPGRAEREAPSSIVVVRTYEELGASGGTVAEALYAIVSRGAHLLVADDELDTRKAAGRGALRHVLRIGRLHAERARERSTEDAKRRRRELRVYGHVPYGFRREGERLVPVPSEIEAVRRARELSGRGDSLAEIAAALNHARLFWKEGARWSRIAVSRVLKNSIYEEALREARP